MLLWNCNFKSVLLVAGYRLAGRLHPTSCYPLYSVPHDLLHCPTLCTRASSYGQPFPTISSDHMDTSTTHTSLINRCMTELPDKMSQTPGRTTQNIAHVLSIPQPQLGICTLPLIQDKLHFSDTVPSWWPADKRSLGRPHHHLLEPTTPRPLLSIKPTYSSILYMDRLSQQDQ